MKKIHLYSIVYTLLIIAPAIFAGAGDNAHFYRATNFWGEPRLPEPWLTTFAASYAGGGTCSARTCCGGQTPLLNIYGLQNMRVLGQGVPFKDFNNPTDIALELLQLIPCRNGFAELLFCGKFSMQEANFFFVQNFCNGGFLWAHAPVRSLQLCNTGIADQSPVDTVYPNINTPQWQMFLNLFNQILTQYNVSLAGTCASGIGDTTVMLGWTNSYEETDDCDYVDFDAAVGVLFPTGKQKQENYAFSLPLGYDGHFAIPVSFNLAFGAYDWLTVGLHADALFFFKKCKNIRMKTSFEQNSFIKLACGQATIQPGNIWNGSFYAKADHFARGFSLLLGYTFSAQQQTIVSPYNLAIFSSSIASSDGPYQPWNMGTLQLMAEYDFTQECAKYGPRVGLFYNWVVNGKKVFTSGIGGAYVGLDIAWDY